MGRREVEIEKVERFAIEWTTVPLMTSKHIPIAESHGT